MPGSTDDTSSNETGHTSQPFISRRRHWLAHALLLGLVFITWGWLSWRVVIPALQENTWPYSAYWIAPRLALEGRAHLVYTESSVYLREIARLNVTGDMLEVNMPTTLLPFLPLALLPIADAFRVWTVFSLACFGVGWLALLRAVRLPASVSLLLTAAVPFFEPFSMNIRGQVYLALFSLVTLSAVYSVAAPTPTTGEAGRPRAWQIVGGVLLGVSAVLKLYYGLALALPALLKRRWTFLAWAALVFVACGLTTTWAWGAGIWERALHLSLTWRERPETAHTAYQTAHSLLARLFRYEEQWNPAPVANLPWLAESLWWLTALSTMSGTVLALWKAGKRRAAPGTASFARLLLATAVVVPLASALAPIGEGYHYALCLFPIVVVATILYEAWRQAWADDLVGSVLPRDLLAVSSGFALAVALLGAPWQYNVARVDGWASLLHYPRLYGALVLWLLMVVLLVRPGVVRHAKGTGGAQAAITSESAP